MSTVLQNIFSVRNNGIHKVITILGIKLKIKSKKLLKKYNVDKNSFLEDIFSIKNHNQHKVVKIFGLKLKFKNKKNTIANRVDNTNYNISSNAGLMIWNDQRQEYSEKYYINDIKNFPQKPCLSIIMPMYEADPQWLKIAIESIQQQYYENWELYIQDDGSTDKRCCAVVKEFANKDNRIKLAISDKNEGISEASNKALNRSQNEFFLLMDQDDELPSDALYWFVKTINENPDIDVIYSDECKKSTNGELFDFYFKPDWSPALLLNHMYVGHLTLYRKQIVENVGLFRKEYDFSQDYDLILRVSEITSKIHHIEKILYYWRALETSGASGGKDFARLSNKKALRDFYTRQGLKAVSAQLNYSNYCKIAINNNPLISIIIPSDIYDNLEKCINEILKKTSYTNIEIIPVTNSKVATELGETFSYVDCLNICKYNKIFNFSDKCNEGAKIAHGEYLVFYNDDVYPNSPDWIERLLDSVFIPGVGAVSPMLVFENNHIQYAGMATGLPGFIGTVFNNLEKNKISSVFHQKLVRNISVLSGACFLISKKIFDDINGFDAINTPNGHSDIDLSFKLLEKGYQLIYNPNSILTHIGNHTWHPKNIQDKSDLYLLKRWGKYLERDSYFTKSMIKMHYLDFNYTSTVFIPEKKWDIDTKNILLISHELSRTGAPLVLLDAVKVLVKNNIFPVVMCPQDGPLRQDFINAGAVVIIDNGFNQNSFLFERFARNFDMVIANTLVTYNAIKLLNNSMPPVMWWIHEGSYALNSFEKKLPQKLSKNVHLFAVSEYCKKIIEPIFGEKIQILSYGMTDCKYFSQTNNNKNNILSMLCIGSIEKRKGQDILLDAIKLLPQQYLEKFKLYFIGSVFEDDILQKIKNMQMKNSNIKYLEPIPKEKIYKYLAEADLVVAPSRDDPCPCTVTEGLMFENMCICSTNCGNSAYIKDKESGFVFKNENIKDLSEILMYVIDNYKNLQTMKKEGRKIYENIFDLSVFENNFLEIISDLTK